MALHKHPVPVATLAVWAWCSAAGPAWAQPPAPAGQEATRDGAVQPAAVPARRIQLPGLPHFGRISPQLSRGAQPKDGGFAELKKLGIAIVVNLRHESDAIGRERALVEAQGMQYVTLPWRGSQQPDIQQIAQFLELLSANPDKQVFVHCARGAERTGVMVACYRIGVEGWTSEQALREMEAFRFRGWRFGHLKDFVRAFPSLLLRDPLLNALRPGR